MVTFGRLLQAYLLSLKQRPSAQRYRQVYDQYFDEVRWRDRPADSITRHEIMFLKQSLAATPAQCTKALCVIKQAYRWGADFIDHDTMRPLYDGHNPAAGVNKPSGKSRERVMDLSEIRRLLENLDFLQLRHQALMVNRTLVPARILELCTMRWADVDLQTGKWLKRYTKNGKAQYILIPRQALGFIKRLPRTSPYVFPGENGQPLQSGSARRMWQRFRKDLKMEDVQLLDFRRTLASYLYTEIKADDLTSKAVLNHYDGRPVAVYTRLNYDQLAGIVQQYADWVWKLAPAHLRTQEPAAPICPTRRATDQEVAHVR